MVELSTPTPLPRFASSHQHHRLSVSHSQRLCPLHFPVSFIQHHLAFFRIFSQTISNRSRLLASPLHYLPCPASAAASSTSTRNASFSSSSRIVFARNKSKLANLYCQSRTLLSHSPCFRSAHLIVHSSLPEDLEEPYRCCSSRSLDPFHRPGST